MSIDLDAVLTPKKKKIIQILLKSPILQKNLAIQLKIKPSTLHYHLSELKKLKLILIEEVDSFGSVVINKIRINSIFLNQFRSFFKIKSKNITLISGIGLHGIEVPYKTLKMLENLFYKINRLVCFVTKESLKSKKENLEPEKRYDIDKTIMYEYSDYRNLESKFCKDIESILGIELEKADLILDATPLSKIFSLKILEIATQFRMPCVYLGLDDNNKDKLFWLIKSAYN